MFLRLFDCDGVLDYTYVFLVVLLNPRCDEVRYTFSRFVTCYLTADYHHSFRIYFYLRFYSFTEDDFFLTIFL